MASSLAAASAIGAKAAPLQRVSSSAKRSARSATVVRAQKNADEVASSSAPVSRREALSAGAALVGTLASASPAFAGLFDGIELPAAQPREKRVVDLPKLEIEPVGREEGYPLANGGEKTRAQQQYIKFIEPIIAENIDLPFQDYMRLALHDAGTYNVVGKTNGANGSIRFELDRPENKDVREAFKSIEKIKNAVDAKVTQPISWADVIAITPHFAARQQFAKDYYEVMGEDDPNYEFLFVGTNPYLGAKMKIGRRDAEVADPEGSIPGPDATCDDLDKWFKRMGLGPNQLCMFAPYLFAGDEQKGVDIVSENVINKAVLDQYASQRKGGKRAPGPAVTIIKNFKALTDNCLPGGNPYVGGDRNPPYVEYAYIRGGGEIPRVTTFGAYPGSADLGSSKFAQKVRGDR